MQRKIENCSNSLGGTPLSISGPFWRTSDVSNKERSQMMTTKKQPTEKHEKKRIKTDAGAKFPYTTKPSSLRRLLQEIPKKPRPPKFDQNLLRAWGFSDANDYSMLRVLKAVGLLNANNEPTDLYSQYMHLEGGAVALADPIKQVYEPLFH